MENNFRNCYNCKYLNYYVAQINKQPKQQSVLFACTREDCVGPHLELARGCDKYESIGELPEGVEPI